ncbi:riboflavin-specific deaminase C-terminal domain-containing protein [Rhizobium sp. RU35A]|uniref:RibD family protein n=1 Tax=Rhizobium sp. RU35A TaxID=1907414 RepID=UPI000957430D|nr:RibD family protein [Rhizobium sp. RU35A]SIQ93865.1 riboflavin-specific deaminase C-terminal domain-containing protein [Rhizobium sp. RU35A]
MRTIRMTETIWASLLAMRSRPQGSKGTQALKGDIPALELYGPIAAADGPFVLGQVGQSLDGRVATPAGDARDISGPDGLAHLHRCRALVEAVIVGVGTVKADNPRLSVREVHGPDPVRVVIDCHGELTGEEGLFHDGGAPVILVQSREAWARPRGAQLIRLPLTSAGLCPHAILEALSERGLSRILVEGGARTLSRFIDQGLVDRLHVAIAPLIIGSGPTGISLPPIEQLADAQRPAARVFNLGSDILFDCALKSPANAGLAAGSARRQGQKVEMPHRAAAALAPDIG